MNANHSIRTLLFDWDGTLVDSAHLGLAAFEKTFTQLGVVFAHDIYEAKYSPNWYSTYEALGQCFIDRKEYDVAVTILSRALREPGMEDEDLIGVLYLLGFSSEESRKPRDAAAYYQRVFAVDIDFRDVSQRLKLMGKAASK